MIEFEVDDQSAEEAGDVEGIAVDGVVDGNGGES